MNAYYENQSLSGLIPQSAVGLALLGIAITGHARDVYDDTALVVGLQWNFRPDTLSLVTSLQSAKVSDSGDIRGWQTKLRLGPDATYHGVSIEWFKGDDHVQPTWGVGYEAQSNTAQLMGGLQTKYLYAGSSYGWDQQWSPYVGITPFGSFAMYRARHSEGPN
ncbi:MAG: hypothetical protein LPH21_12615 [Shewanella sp.]|nr:hypothetical protein [Shewanella sp.]